MNLAVFWHWKTKFNFFGPRTWIGKLSGAFYDEFTYVYRIFLSGKVSKIQRTVFVQNSTLCANETDINVPLKCRGVWFSPVFGFRYIHLQCPSTVYKKYLMSTWLRTDFSIAKMSWWNLSTQHTNKCTYIVFNKLKFILKHLKRSYMFRSHDHHQGAYCVPCTSAARLKWTAYDSHTTRSKHKSKSNQNCLIICL